MLLEPGHSESRICYWVFFSSSEMQASMYLLLSLSVVFDITYHFYSCLQSVIQKSNNPQREQKSRPFLSKFLPAACCKTQSIPLLSLIHFPLSHCLTVKVSGKTEKPKWSNQPELSADVCILRGEILFPVFSTLVPNACLDWEQLAVPRLWQERAITAGRSTW